MKRPKVMIAVWSEYLLEDIGCFSKGEGLPRSELQDLGVPCIRYGEIYTHHHFIVNTLVSWISGESAKSSVKAATNTLLFAGSGETLEDIGKCVAYMGKESICVGGDIVILAVHERRARADYLSYWLNTEGRRQMNRLGQGQSIVHITPKHLAKIRLPVPPLPEQTAIAEVLACWDKAIRLYERKLEMNREIKKGLMRKLLAGEWRLPGFSGKWASARFGEVFGFVKTYAYSREQLTIRGAGSSILNIHYGDLHSSYTDILLDVGNEKQIPEIKIGVDVPDDLNCLRDGDLVIADASEDYKGVGACVEIKNVGDRKLIGGLHTMVARDSDGRTVPGYRGYILKETVVAKTMQQMATGVSVHGLSKSNLSKIAIRLPSPDEQHAIASVLADADKDISCLASKLTLLRDQKKYLLSKLVTGAIRLPQFREAS